MPRNNVYTTAKPLKALRILHTAMLAGMVVFCVVSAVVHLWPKMASNSTVNKVLQVTVLAISFASVKTGLSIFDRKLRAIDPAASPEQKLSVYRVAAIIKWAMIEMPVLCTVVCFMITRNYAFIVLAFAMIIFFALQAPAKMKMMLQLQLTEDDMNVLEGPSQ